MPSQNLLNRIALLKLLNVYRKNLKNIPHSKIEEYDLKIEALKEESDEAIRNACAELLKNMIEEIKGSLATIVTPEKITAFDKAYDRCFQALRNSAVNPREALEKLSKEIAENVLNNGNLLKLPHDILLQIFIALPVTEVSQVARTSKVTRQVVNGEMFWQILCNENISSKPKEEEITVEQESLTNQKALEIFHQKQREKSQAEAAKHNPKERYRQWFVMQPENMTTIYVSKPSTAMTLKDIIEQGLPCTVFKKAEDKNKWIRENLQSTLAFKHVYFVSFNVAPSIVEEQLKKKNFTFLRRHLVEIRGEFNNEVIGLDDPLSNKPPSRQIAKPRLGRR